MSYGPLVVEIVCIFIVTAFLLHHYGNLRKQRVLVTVGAFVAWYFSFMIIFILPLDVTSTYYRQCLRESKYDVNTFSPTSANVTSSGVTTPSPTTPNVSGAEVTESESKVTGEPTEPTSVCQVPTGHVPDYVLPTLWHVVYWTSQVLTWIILPMMQSYSNAGDFSVAGKLKTSLIQNAIYYGTYLLIFGVCLIYVAARPDLDVDAEKLKVIGVTASNTWGLFLLVLLLGYGLVEVPRSIWNNSKRGYTLSKTQFKIAKLSTEKSEAEEELEDVLEDIKKAAESIKYNHPLRKNVDTILRKCPESFLQTIRNMDDYQDYNMSTETPTQKSLIRLHCKLIRASQNQFRTRCQWNMLIEKALELEDLAANENNTDKKFRKALGQNNYHQIFRMVYTPTVEWYWKVQFRPITMKVFSVLLMIFSFMVVWSECLFFIKEPVLSLFAVFINLAKENYDYLYIELASIIVIGYLCICAYSSIFQIRILNYYYIAPHHQTDENSLLFCGMMLCRLTPPMCLNFLGLIHLDSHVIHEHLEETSYTQIMGHMDVVSFISDGFNVYFPIAIVLLCIFTYFSLGSRILHFLGFQQFIGEDDMTQELVDEGRELIKREKRKRERVIEGEERRRMWNERFGDERSGDHRIDQLESHKRAPDSPLPGRHKVARSPDENDRTELLKEAEPVDYTGQVTDSPDLMSERYQPSGYRSQVGRYGAARSASRPPRGIFDDI
ncbi:G-protein coupled receptor-associated protein LMBRD2-like [Liolophura sinensis]|uniref:G-protein coupled receptor-associated protein LMBRD2-like n=1 Tax=Liolophura sinensis TaxID=3198878 RepID=UPI0031585CD3